MTTLSVAGFILFMGIEASIEHPLLDLGLFRYRNYSVSMALAVFRSIGLFGGIFLLPIFLENLVGYTTIQTRLWMMPGAIAVGFFMPVAGRLADRFNPRGLVTFGTILTGASLVMYGNLDPRTRATGIIGPQLIRSVGLAFMMAPLITAALNAVSRRAVATASSFLNIVQRVGGAFGIALLNTFVTNSAHTHAVRMGAKLPVQSVGFGRLAGKAAEVTGGAVSGVSAAVRTIGFRSQVMAFQNGFVFGGILLLVGGGLLNLQLVPDTSHEHHETGEEGAPSPVMERTGPPRPLLPPLYRRPPTESPSWARFGLLRAENRGSQRLSVAGSMRRVTVTTLNRDGSDV